MILFLRGFPLDTPASSHSAKTGKQGELGTLNCAWEWMRVRIVCFSLCGLAKYWPFVQGGTSPLSDSLQQPPKRWLVVKENVWMYILNALLCILLYMEVIVSFMLSTIVQQSLLLFKEGHFSEWRSTPSWPCVGLQHTAPVACPAPHDKTLVFSSIRSCFVYLSICYWW